MIYNLNASFRHRKNEISKFHGYDWSQSSCEF